MALRWKIDRELVTVLAEGKIGRAEVEKLLDEILTDDVVPLAKLVDCGAASDGMALEDWLAVALRMKDRQAVHAGPLAMVQPKDSESVRRLLGILATFPRPMKIFRSRQAALRWIGTFRSDGARAARIADDKHGSAPWRSAEGDVVRPAPKSCGSDAADAPRACGHR